MTGSGLSVVLHYGGSRINELQTSATESLDDAASVSAELDGLDRRVEQLLAATRHASTGAESTLQPTVARPPGPRTPTVAVRAERTAWDTLVAEAASQLQQRGIDPAGLDIDQLLDRDEVERLNRRHQGGFTIRAELDPCDILTAVAAGLTACIIDVMVVRIPADTKWYGNGETVVGSPLTKFLRDLSVDDDNWLAKWAKVPYDRITGLPESVSGLFPKSHRVQTFGHDPLLGLVMGTWDIMHGTMTAVPRGGGVTSMDVGGAIPNPFLAFATQVAHLLSDAPTKCGLPLPGWLAVASVDAGVIGPNAETIGAVARRMYLNGYDSWHLLTMMTSVGALELVLRGYWGLRGALDPEWHGDVAVEGQVAGSTAVSDHPRFAAMALLAHGVAAAGNLGKVAFMNGNPLALNYAEWLAFSRAFYKWTDLRTRRPTDVVDAQVRANAMAIAAGWEGLDFTDPDFPAPASFGLPG